MTDLRFNKYDESVLKALRISTAPDVRSWPTPLRIQEAVEDLVLQQSGQSLNVEVELDRTTGVVSATVEGRQAFARWMHQGMCPELLTHRGFIPINLLVPGDRIKLRPRTEAPKAAPEPPPTWKPWQTRVLNWEFDQWQHRNTKWRRDLLAALGILALVLTTWLWMVR